MIKYAIVMAGIVVLAAAQRPPYAGRRGSTGLEVLPQYLPEAEQNTPRPKPELNGRIGDEADMASTHDYNPYDPYNDPEELARIAALPRDLQPFWYVNRKWLADRINVQSKRRPETVNVIPSVISRGSFAGQWK